MYIYFSKHLDYFHFTYKLKHKIINVYAVLFSFDIHLAKLWDNTQNIKEILLGKPPSFYTKYYYLFMKALSHRITNKGKMAKISVCFTYFLDKWWTLVLFIIHVILTGIHLLWIKYQNRCWRYIYVSTCLSRFRFFHLDIELSLFFLKHFCCKSLDYKMYSNNNLSSSTINIAKALY